MNIYQETTKVAKWKDYLMGVVRELVKQRERVGGTEFQAEGTVRVKALVLEEQGRVPCVWSRASRERVRGVGGSGKVSRREKGKGRAEKVSPTVDHLLPRGAAVCNHHGTPHTHKQTKSKSSSKILQEQIY